MFKSEDCNEPDKPIIKNERSDVENYVTEVTIIKIEKYEHITAIKSEELHIKDELDTEEVCASESVPEAEDCNDSAERGTSKKKKKQNRKSPSKEKQQHFCPKCPFSTKWKKNLEKHNLTHHSDRPLDRQSSGESAKFKCRYCDYKSNRSQNLSSHVSAIHEREKAAVYSCQQCTFETVQASNLRRHLTLHGEKSPHKCPGCEKGFGEKRALDDHLLRKHDDLGHLIASRIYDCKCCSYNTTYTLSMKRHVTIKHNRKNAEKFRCNDCNYFTLHRGDLVRHLAIHSNLRLHQCPSCKRGFNRKKTLDSHIANEHERDAQ